MPKPNTPTPRALLAALPAEQVALFQNVAALRGIVADELARQLQRAQVAIQDPVWSVGSQRANLLPHVGTDFPAASVLLTHLESSAEYGLARDAIAPALAALAALEQREAEAALERADKQRRHADALAAAEAKALDAARNDPAVVAARRELEALA